MTVTDDFVFVYCGDDELVLWSLAAVTPKGSRCVAIALDVETGIRYRLIDSAVARPVEPPPTIPP